MLETPPVQGLVQYYSTVVSTMQSAGQPLYYKVLTRHKLSGVKFDHSWVCRGSKHETAGGIESNKTDSWVQRHRHVRHTFRHRS